jgi:hypothetical protein
MSFSIYQSPEVDKSRPPPDSLSTEHQSEVANPVWQYLAQHDGGGVPSIQTQLDAGVAETGVGGDAEHEAPTDAGVGLPGGVPSPVPAAAPAPVGPNACNTQAGSRYFCESLFWASQPKQAAKT